MSAFANRLEKNWKHRKKWAERQQLTAFRTFDLDMPEFPVAIDWYDGRVVVLEYPRRRAVASGAAEAMREDVLAGVRQVLEVPDEKVFLKTHEKHVWGKAQYGRVDGARAIFPVQENGLKFEVNLGEYLDTGLFMDHRNTRLRVKKEAGGKRFLNLFAYTGSFSVYAAAGGAKSTTTVDLSNTYGEWAERNLRLNGFSAGHSVIRADVLQWLESCRDTFELAVLDPPSFSTSKKMSGAFNVQKDQRWLIDAVLARLSPGGTLYFSNNFLGFELDPALKPAEELTPKSIPEDFRRTVHRCWRFVRG